MIPPSTSRLHTAGSDHNVHPSTADFNILLKIPAKTSFFSRANKNSLAYLIKLLECNVVLHFTLTHYIA